MYGNNYENLREMRAIYRSEVVINLFVWEILMKRDKYKSSKMLFSKWICDRQKNENINNNKMTVNSKHLLAQQNSN